MLCIAREDAVSMVGHLLVAFASGLGVGALFTAWKMTHNPPGGNP